MRPSQTPHVIGIAGPSGSGKTSLALLLAARLPGGGVVVALDAYYRDQRDVPDDAINVDVPEALDHALLVAQVRALSAGEIVQQPVYDYATHARLAVTRAVHPAPFVIVEGLFALYWPEVRAVVTTPLYLSLDHERCLARRVERDARERGVHRTPCACSTNGPCAPCTTATSIPPGPTPAWFSTPPSRSRRSPGACSPPSRPRNPADAGANRPGAVLRCRSLRGGCRLAVPNDSPGARRANGSHCSSLFGIEFDAAACRRTAGSPAFFSPPTYPLGAGFSKLDPDSRGGIDGSVSSGLPRDPDPKSQVKFDENPHPDSLRGEV